jgi:chromosome segregation ATPase
MMSHHEARQVLARMEARLRETRHNLFELERSMRDRAETEAIRSRPKKHRYNRRMTNWTGADEEAYRQVLDRLIDNAAADLDRLRRKVQRQDAAIETLRQKYRVNAGRPTFTPL